jgi:hypothetical protein
MAAIISVGILSGNISMCVGIFVLPFLSSLLSTVVTKKSARLLSHMNLFYKSLKSIESLVVRK